jgi:hypothetical protein
MAEVLARFAEPLTTTDGVQYLAQACGAPNTDGLWEGWIEFAPIGKGEAIRSARETTQPNRTDAEYWATGLTATYLEGALDRALHPIVRRTVTAARPIFDESAPGIVARDEVPIVPRAVLDPFSVYEKGEGLLRKELGALSAWHLANIIRHYDLSDESPAVLNRMNAAALVELIVRGVRSEVKA